MALVDVLAYDQSDGETVYKTVEAGRTAEVVAATRTSTGSVVGFSERSRG
jgi:hypothetical protein